MWLLNPYREYMLQRLISLTFTSWPKISHHRSKLKRIVQLSLDLFCKTYPLKIPLFCATCFSENLDLSFHENGLVKCLLLCILYHTQGHGPPNEQLLIDLFSMDSKKMTRNGVKNATAAKLQRSNDTPKHLFSRDCRRQAVF